MELATLRRDRFLAVLALKRLRLHACRRWLNPPSLLRTALLLSFCISKKRKVHAVEFGMLKITVV